MNLNKEQVGYVEAMMHKYFWFFVQSLMPAEWYDEKFHRALCEFLQYAGNQKVVVLPRTHLKTTICSSYYPLWSASIHPGERNLLTSNTSPNAEKTVRQIKAVVETNKMYQAFFPECIPEFNKVRWSDRCACLNRPEDFPEGTFEAAGVGANIIRRHFNRIIEDDTVAPRKDDLTGEECMPSKEDIQQAVGFHRLTPPLLINEKDEQLVVGTRWREDDHIGWIMKNEKYEVFDKAVDKQVDGEPGTLYKRFSEHRLETIRVAMGSYLYSALYLNKPLASEFMCFKPSWITYYDESEVPDEGTVTITVDPADPPTGKRSQDYTAIVSCLHSPKGIYVRRYRRERLSDKQLIDAALAMAELDSAVRIRVEIDRYAHLQFGFKQAMATSGRHYFVDAVKTRGKAKEARIRQRLQPLFESGIIRLRRGMRELEEELYAFPNGAHDDLIDALAWQVEGINAVQPPKSKPLQPTRHLPTVDEMYNTLLKRSGNSQLPFDLQVGGGTKRCWGFQN